MGGQTSTVTERKTRLDGSVAEFTCEPLRLDAGRYAALRYVTDREWRVADGTIVVPKGTLTVGHYWIERPYYVYHWLAGGRTVAFYCSIATMTEISDLLVAYDDLTVDVLVRPSFAIDILDEDELPADLAPAHRLVIAKALERLMADPRGLAREVEGATKRVLD